MITWIHYWPFLPMPTLLLSAMAAIPTRTINGHLVGGGPVREFCLNNFAWPALSLPVWPAGSTAQLVAWFSTASEFQEWLLTFVVALNINAILLPLLYGLGVAVIGLSSWHAKKNIDQKRNAMR